MTVLEKVSRKAYTHSPKSNILLGLLIILYFLR